MLSLVIMSCGGTSSVTTCRLTLTARSIGAKTKTTPGPLVSGSTRPSLKITARSYSFTILIEFYKYIKHILPFREKIFTF